MPEHHTIATRILQREDAIAKLIRPFHFQLAIDKRSTVQHEERGGRGLTRARSSRELGPCPIRCPGLSKNAWQRRTPRADSRTSQDQRLQSWGKASGAMPV
eukprot:2011021-Rhodomonas_salina.1